jgi:hypothetical protein
MDSGRRARRWGTRIRGVEMNRPAFHRTPRLALPRVPRVRDVARSRPAMRIRLARRFTGEYHKVFPKVVIWI